MSEPRNKELAERVQRLENSRHKIIGQMNALRAVSLTALLTIVQKSSSPPAKVIAELRAAWLPVSPEAPKIFRGANAAELGAFQQEYEASVTDILAELEVFFHLPNYGHPRK